MSYQVQIVVLVVLEVVEYSMSKHDKIKELLTEVITKASEKFVEEGGNMRKVLKGDMKDKLVNK